MIFFERQRFEKIIHFKVFFELEQKFSPLGEKTLDLVALIAFFISRGAIWEKTVVQKLNAFKKISGIRAKNF